MTEQERPKSPVQFPRVPEETFDRAIRDTIKILSEFKDLSQNMQKEEPMLKRLITSLSNRGTNPKSFRTGAYYCYAVLDCLEKEGFSLPKVKPEVLATFEDEYLSARRELNGLDPNTFVEKSKFVKFNFPMPEKYANENPDLMELFHSLPIAMKIGAAVVYELKRRQFFSDQLKKQFGE